MNLDKVFFIFISLDFLLPTCSPQVIGWGPQNSIGKSPFNLSTYFQNYTKGINDYLSWPNGIVPYTFDYNNVDPGDNSTLTPPLAAQQIAHFQRLMNNTCIRFVPRTNETDYINIRFGPGCTSYVGRQGGMQNINVQTWCFPNTHEVIHALGFVHEQERRDRDYYISFNWTNFNTAHYSYYTLKNYPTFGTELDPKSDMMYAAWTSAINSSFPVSVYKDGSDSGVNLNFKLYSEGDRQKINRRYNCNPDDNCWDEDPFNCPVWAAAGGCKDPNWVLNVCQKQCCYDLYPSTCPANLKAKGPSYCNTTWAMQNCNVTCNFCPNTPNQRSDCLYIGATLGCSNNTAVGGMGKYCRQSCGICTRPANVVIKPMIITKCMNTCHPTCIKNNGCNLSLPPNNPDYDQTKPISQCTTLPLKSGFTTAQWCAFSKWAQYYCQTTCKIRRTCHPQCVDQDKDNCPRLAAKQGCFSLYNL